MTPTYVRDEDGTENKFKLGQKFSLFVSIE